MVGTRLALPLVAALVLGCGPHNEVQANKPPTEATRFDPARVLTLDITRNGNELVAVGERGLIWTAESADRPWSAHATLSNRTLTAVAFADGGIGVAVGHGATLFRTTDGGKTWAPIELEEAGGDSLMGVTHLGGGRFIAYGVFGLYLVSDDNGRTWIRQELDLDADETAAQDDAEPDGEHNPFDRHIMKVLRLDQKLLLVGESGTLAESADGGNSWRRIASPYNGSFFGAVISASGALIAYGMRGNVYRSTDGGASWTHIALGTISAINGGTVLADGRVVLVGNNGLLAISRDDGASFQTHLTNGGGDIAQVVESASGDLVGVGAAGIKRIELPAGQS